MKQRVLQFYRAVTAKITDEDRAFIAGLLDEEEEKLFYGMEKADQYHALRVARTAEKLAERRGSVRLPLLLRAALLHDVGRVKGDLGIWGKVLAVLFDHYAGGFSRRWAKEEGVPPLGRLRHALYVYYHHAEIGAQKLEALGKQEEAAIIRRHHLPEEKSDPAELVILREADGEN